MFLARMLNNLWMPNIFRQFLSILTPKMVPNHVSTLLKQTLTTFTCDKELFHHNLEILQSILDKTTAEDIGFNSKFMDPLLWTTPDKAPVTYIDIYEDKIVTMGIFILKPGMKLPLHNHPYMHGLLKVVAGTIRIKSFSLKSKKAERDIDVRLELGFNSEVTATKNDDIVAVVDSKCCLLGPEYNNIHEIESVDGPAAFLDILSPPYNTNIENNGPRKCVYFQVCKEIQPQVFRLVQIPPPRWFFSDSYPYTGPKLAL